MSEYNKNLEQEKAYLDYIIKLLECLIEADSAKLTDRKKEMISSKKDMWENSAHFSNDFDKLTEMNQYLQDVQSRTFDYESTKKNIEKHRAMLDSPYFGRIDFIEDGEEENEKIYIGKGNITDPETREIAVYDWRAPISSMFYRFEPGKASFKAPSGEIIGEIKLKRQYKIAKSELKYYFDCSIQISDEILQEVLSRNSSPQMRTIIETIQKEQDIIIRDLDNDLLIVQGVAGSGKTSIALHRIAFLLYEGMSSKLSSNNILVLSPNDAFSNYIGHVLPELGEENVERATLEGIIRECVQDEVKRQVYPQFKGRSQQLEDCISGRDNLDGDTVSRWIQFKGSDTFKMIIDRYIKYYERRLIKFDDAYYANHLIASRHELKSDFLNNKIGMPIGKRLSRIENRLNEAIEDLRKERLKTMEDIVERTGEHQFEVKSFARYLMMKDSQAFALRLKRFTEIDIIDMYEQLFRDKELFHKMSRGLEMPENIDGFLGYTYDTIRNKCMNYEDWAAVAYIKLMVFGSDGNSNIRQVIIDEVQDYYPLQLAIMNELYGEARFTVVGDVAQSIERSGEYSIYDEMPRILEKSKTIRLTLNRSYRSSFEINEFAKKVAGGMDDCISFPRHEKKPGIMEARSNEEIETMVIDSINEYFSEGFETVTILCKTMRKAQSLYQRLKDKIKIHIVDDDDKSMDKGCFIMPVYAAKGLEFDAVIIYGVDDANFCTELDKRLLYVACTRALHRLSIYYIGKMSRFLKGCEKFAE